MEPVVSKARAYKDALNKVGETEALLEVDDEEMRSLAEMELESLRETIATLEEDLKGMLVPKDPRDERNVIMEIRAGTGGDEAGLFAADLFRMYSRYAERRGWKTEILTMHETGIGGDQRSQFYDTGAMQFYGTSIENFVVGNRGTRMPGFRGMGLWYHGYQPSWYCQFIDNEIIEGNYYHWHSAAEAKIDILGARRGDYEGPLNKGPVVRRNRLDGNAHIRISGTCRDVIVEGNHVANNDQGIFVSKTVENSLVRENTFENVTYEVIDEGGGPHRGRRTDEEIPRPSGTGRGMGF